jgi:hypothetical protein
MFASSFTEFVANDVCDVQSRNRQVTSDLLQDDVGRIVRADIKIRACVGDHSLGH